MMYYAQTTKRGWRVFKSVDRVDICGAVNKDTAIRTADELNRFYGHRRTGDVDLSRAGTLILGAALGSLL
jgi:hypothetical protein